MTVNENSESNDSDFQSGFTINPSAEKNEAATLQGDRTQQINDQDESKSSKTLTSRRSKKYVNLKRYVGYQLLECATFKNVIDGKPVENYEWYFQVSPAYFARRSMMKTATVRKLLNERKLPRLYEGDHVMVVVSALWLGGLPGAEAWINYTFEPEDYF